MTECMNNAEQEFCFSPDRMMDRSAIFMMQNLIIAFYMMLYMSEVLFLNFHDLYSVMQYCIHMAYHFLEFHCIFHCVDTNQI